MGKKQYQSGARYAKQGSQPKKRRPQKPRIQSEDPVSSNIVAESASAPEPSAPKSPEYSVQASGTLAYVLSDLKRTGIFAALAFIILIILAIIL